MNFEYGQYSICFFVQADPTVLGSAFVFSPGQASWFSFRVERLRLFKGWGFRVWSAEVIKSG